MFRRIPLTILCPANKIEQNFHFPQFGHRHRTKFIGTPNEIELYRTKSNAHGFDIYTNKKVIFSCLEIENQGRKLSGGRGNWKLVPPPSQKNIRTG